MSAVYSISGGVAPVRPNHITSTGAAAVPPAAKGDSRYDHLSLSSGSEVSSRFRMGLVSRLSQEVRASTTTGDIQELRRQIQSCEYQPDAAEIAARMLLSKGVDA